MQRPALLLLVLALIAGCGASEDAAGDDAGRGDTTFAPLVDAGGTPGADTTLRDGGGPAGDADGSGADIAASDLVGGDTGAADVGAPRDAVTPEDAAPPDDGEARWDVPLPQGRCLDDGAAAGPFFVVPDGAPGQLALSGAFDGRGVWLAWNEPGADSGFDVWAARIGCDGGYLVAPFRVHVVDHGNDFGPSLAVSGGTVLVAWSGDTGGDPSQAVHYRTFRAVDGAPLMAEEAVYVAIQGGEAIPENGWMPATAALTNGDFLIAAALGVNKAQRFQIVLQRLGADGAPAFDADGQPENSIYAWFQPTGTQLHPAVAAAADGGAFVAWTESADTLANEVRHTRLPAGAARTDPFPAAVPPDGGLAAGPDYAAAPGTSVYLSFHTEGEDPDIVVTDGARFDGAGPTLTLGEAGRFDHSPRVAPRLGGGLVAWLTLRGGTRNDVHVQRFSYVAGGFTRIGATRLLNPSGADPHDAATQGRPAAIHVGDDTYLVVWSEGPSGQQRLRGEFLVF